MKAAIRFEVARAIGDDLVRPREAAAAAEPQARRRVGPHQARIHSFVHDRDSVAVAFQVLRALPFLWPQSIASRPSRFSALRVRSPIGASGSGGN